MPGKKKCFLLCKKSNIFIFLKGPAIPAGEGDVSAESAGPAFYFVYNLRPKEDYLYFKVNN